MVEQAWYVFRGPFFLAATQRNTQYEFGENHMKSERAATVCTSPGTLVVVSVCSGVGMWVAVKITHTW